MKVSPILAVLMAMISSTLPACRNTHASEEHQKEYQKMAVTSPKAKDVIITEEYVCQIRSQRHINVRAFHSGYLESMQIREGQSVQAGEVMFKIAPSLYQARVEAEVAEAHLAQVEFDNSNRLFLNKLVSQQEVIMHEAKLTKALAKLKLSEAELNFATVKAPFDGIVDRLQTQRGSLVKEGDTLTTLSDNRVMWAYFDVPEARYVEYMADLRQDKESKQIELLLAANNKFPHPGKISAIGANFNTDTGNISFRVDFPNPNCLLRHGQTGAVLIHRTLKNAIVIPQRATFSTLDKKYVYVVGKDDVVHQREIVIKHELEDVFVIKKGLDVNDRIILDRIRQVHEGEKIKCEFRSSVESMANQN